MTPDRLTRILHRVTSPAALQWALVALTAVYLAVGSPTSAVTAAVGAVVIGAVRGEVAEARRASRDGQVTITNAQLGLTTTGDMRHAKVTPPEASYQNGVIGQRETT